MKWQKIIKGCVPSKDPRIFTLGDNLYAFDADQSIKEGKEMNFEVLHMKVGRLIDMIEQCNYYEQHGNFKDN